MHAFKIRMQYKHSLTANEIFIMIPEVWF